MYYSPSPKILYNFRIDYQVNEKAGDSSDAFHVAPKKSVQVHLFNMVVSKSQMFNGYMLSRRQ